MILYNILINLNDNIYFLYYYINMLDEHVELYLRVIN